MDFRILGSLEVWDGDRQLELGGTKRRAVLAFLLLHPNEVVGVDRLVDQLWGERMPRNAAAAIRTHVSRLRKELGPDVVATRTWGYVLRTDPDRIDLHRFERRVADAENLAARERGAMLREALALWRGSPLEDVAFEPALAKEIARLGELRLTVLENRIDADLEAGEHNGLTGELETLIAAHPLRERLRGQLILTLYRSGRQAEALEVYRETRRVLVDELGLEPSPELRDLERAILRQDPALQPAIAAELPPTPVSSERPGRRRRIYLGTVVATLLVGFATAASFAFATRHSTVAHRVRPPKQAAVTQIGPRFVVLPRARHFEHRKTKARPAAAASPTGTPQPARSSTKQHTQKHVTKTVVVRRPRPKPIRIADDFSDPTLDPLIWTSWSAGSGSDYTQTGGQAVFSIAGDASFDPQFHGAGTNIGTKCVFPGNFDARVDFSVLRWPTANGAVISLMALQGYSAVELVSRVTAPWADGYNAWPSGTTLGPLRDQSGSLRLTRSRGIIRAYLLHDGNWEEIGREAFVGRVSIGLGLGTFRKDWQGQDVSATIDNFQLAAADAMCPTGSDPRNP